MMGRECSWLDSSYQHGTTLYLQIQAATNYTPSMNQHYYIITRLIAHTNLLTPKGWIAG